MQNEWGGFLQFFYLLLSYESIFILLLLSANLNRKDLTGFDRWSIWRFSKGIVSVLFMWGYLFLLWDNTNWQYKEYLLITVCSLRMNIAPFFNIFETNHKRKFFWVYALNELIIKTASLIILVFVTQNFFAETTQGQEFWVVDIYMFLTILIFTTPILVEAVFSRLLSTLNTVLLSFFFLVARYMEPNTVFYLSMVVYIILLSLFIVLEKTLMSRYKVDQILISDWNSLPLSKLLKFSVRLLMSILLICPVLILFVGKILVFPETGKINDWFIGSALYFWFVLVKGIVFDWQEK